MPASGQRASASPTRIPGTTPKALAAGETSPTTCLRPGSEPQPIELGVVEAGPHGDAPGRGVVVWLKCLAAA